MPWFRRNCELKGRSGETLRILSKKSLIRPRGVISITKEGMPFSSTHLHGERQRRWKGSTLLLGGRGRGADESGRLKKLSGDFVRRAASLLGAKDEGSRKLVGRERYEVRGSTGESSCLTWGNLSREVEAFLKNKTDGGAFLENSGGG